MSSWKTLQMVAPLLCGTDSPPAAWCQCQTGGGYDPPATKPPHCVAGWRPSCRSAAVGWNWISNWCPTGAWSGGAHTVGACWPVFTGGQLAAPGSTWKPYQDTSGRTAPRGNRQGSALPGIFCWNPDVRATPQTDIQRSPPPAMVWTAHCKGRFSNPWIPVSDLGRADNTIPPSPGIPQQRLARNYRLECSRRTVIRKTTIVM